MEADNSNEESVLSILPNGIIEWRLYGVYHRENGPAVEYSNGAKVWFLYGEFHHEDGPAVEYSNGDKGWRRHGEQYDR